MIAADIVEAERIIWQGLLYPDGTLKRTHETTQVKISREKLRVKGYCCDKILCSFQEKFLERAKELQQLIQGISKEDLLHDHY